MKQFVMSMFATEKDLYKAKAEYLEKVVGTHKEIFQWVKDNPGCHPENIRKEVLRLLDRLND